MSKWGYAWRKGLERNCLIQIIAAVVGLPLALCLIVTAVLLATSLPTDGDGTTLIWLFVCLAPLGLLLLGGPFAAVYIVTRRRARWLDELFSPLGLDGSSYTMTGRQYHGRYRDRQLDVYIYRGPGVRFHVSADVATRLSAASEEDVAQSLAKLFNGPPLTHNQPGLKGITLFAHEDAWGQAFAADPAIADVVPQLIHGENSFLFRQVHVWPGAVHLQLWRSDRMLSLEITAEQVAEWTELLLRLAELIERLPPPSEKLALTPLEERARRESSFDAA